MFHKSCLGRFGRNLPCDRLGFVPEKGDRFDAFDFQGDVGEDDFPAFRDKAIADTEKADTTVEDWRRNVPIEQRWGTLRT